MRPFPFSNYTFLALTVERPKLELQEILFRNGYVYARCNKGFGDLLYVHRSIAETPFAAKLASIPASHHECRSIGLKYIPGSQLGGDFDALRRQGLAASKVARA